MQENSGFKNWNVVALELVGWYGTIAIIGAYFLNNFQIIDVSNIVYQVLNITGALGIIAISFYKKVYQSVLLNIIWSVIGIVALIKILF